MLSELENLFIDISPLKKQKEELKEKIKIAFNLHRFEAEEKARRSQLGLEAQHHFNSLVDANSLEIQKEKDIERLAASSRSALEKGKAEINLTVFVDKVNELSEKDSETLKHLDLADYRREYLNNIKRVNTEKIESNPFEKAAQQVAVIVQEIVQELDQKNAKSFFSDLIKSLVVTFFFHIFEWKTDSERRTAYKDELTSAYKNFKTTNNLDSLKTEIDNGINNFPNEPFREKLENLKDSLEALPAQQTSALSNN